MTPNWLYKVQTLVIIAFEAQFPFRQFCIPIQFTTEMAYSISVDIGREFCGLAQHCLEPDLNWYVDWSGGFFTKLMRSAMLNSLSDSRIVCNWKSEILWSWSTAQSKQIDYGLPWKPWHRVCCRKLSDKAVHPWSRMKVFGLDLALACMSVMAKKLHQDCLLLEVFPLCDGCKTITARK